MTGQGSCTCKGEGACGEVCGQVCGQERVVVRTRFGGMYVALLAWRLRNEAPHVRGGRVKGKV